MDKWRWINCAIAELDLKVLSYGQSFRWRLISDEEEPVWQGVAANRVWRLKREGSRLCYKVLGRFSNCSSDESDQEALIDYFQLGHSLDQLYSRWSECDPHFADVCRKIPGIRVLRQHPTECLFSFICSSNNNIKRISGMVETLCRLYGEELTVDSGLDSEDLIAESEGGAAKTFYNFPPVSPLAGDGVEAALRQNGFGYRARYLANTARRLIDKYGDEAEKQLWCLRSQDRTDVKEFLLSLDGVGPKVADCISLMSLDKTDALPVDTHVWRVTRLRYMRELSEGKSLTAKIYEKIGDFYRCLFGEHAGWAHSVLFSAEIARK